MTVGVAAALIATVSMEPGAAAEAAVPNRPAAATQTAAVPTSHLVGTAAMYFPAPDNDIRISVDAHATFNPNGDSRPTRSWGTFRISHRVKMPDGTWYTNWGELTVDCLTTGGPTATVTGILTKVTPGGPWEKMLKRRERMGLSFYVAHKGAGPSRIGMSGGPGPGDGPLRKCMAPAADSPVLEGGYLLIDKR
ncbi:hypothetical protein ACQHIV_03805 [Kribbella sp. GL6]|uniref:hypothetical protein n=1 Tax=Kribbella sp. GL6 TaxID=3419765 RepID=UPI003D00F911